MAEETTQAEEQKKDSAAKIEAKTVALSAIDRLGHDSPVSLLATNAFLLRQFCEAFLPRHEIVDGIALASEKSPSELVEALHLARYSKEKKELVSAGIFEATVDAMLRHSKVAAVQAAACFQLAILADKKKAKERLRNVGGVDAIIQVFINHIASVEAMREAAFSLGVLALDQAAASAAVDKRAPELIFEAMSQHQDDVEVVRHSVIALGNMAKVERKVAFSVRAIETVLAAMRKHSDSSKVASDGAYALGKLCFEDPTNKAKAMQLGATDLLISALTKFTDEDVMAADCCRALATIASKIIEHQARICEAKGIDCIVSVMRGCPDDKDVQVEACYALTNLLSATPQFTRFSSQLVVEAVRRSMEKFPDIKLIQHCYATVTRTESPAITTAKASGMCTLCFSPRCAEPCPAASLMYCEACAIPQLLIVCKTCFGARGRRVCEPCFARFHSGHERIETFVPGFCACTRTECQTPKI